MELVEERSSNSNFDIEDPLLQSDVRREKSKQFFHLHGGCKTTIIIVVTLLLMAFSVIFVDFPLVFMHSITLQQKVLFMPSTSPSEDFKNVRKYAQGVRNFYVTVNETANITLGVWHFLPEALLDSSRENENFNYTQILAEKANPVLLHFHDNSGNRIYNVEMYRKLRKIFHVIAFDYRGYGDSSKGTLKEEEIVLDSVELYKWLLLHAVPSNIYVWGKSLGAALAAHTIAKLHDGNVTPMGLILEAPFTTLREAVEHSYLAKAFSWLPWFGVTILDGFERNGFYFKTTEHILKADCPILILQTDDNHSVPFSLTKKLYKIAQENRNPETQGNVTFSHFAANYEHGEITNAPELMRYIKQHINDCQAFNKIRGSQC